MNYALTAHEKGLHSSFTSDYQLSRSGKALNMPKFLQLSIDCPMCHTCKINKSIPSPGRATKEKQCTVINRNNMPLAQPLQEHNLNVNSHDIHEITHDMNRLKHTLNTEEIKTFKSLLLSRMRLRLALNVDESLCPPGSLIYVDFVFCLI